MTSSRGAPASGCTEPPLVVLACPRSGTGWLADMQRLHGYDIRHEALGQQGIVSWCLLLDERYIGPTWAEVQAALPDAIVRHQVREPLAVLLSMHKITSRGMRVLRRLIGYNGPTTEMLVRAYLELNRRAEQLTDDRYKVEDAARFIRTSPTDQLTKTAAAIKLGICRAG